MPAAKKNSKSKAQKSAPAPAPEPVVEVAATTESEATAPATSSSTGVEWSDIENQFSDIGDRLKQFRDLYASITADVRKLQKNVQRHLRDTARKNKRKKKNTDGPKRAPSGFAKPALISVELCTFLGKPKGTEMARTEVTKFLTTYIKEHNLQDQANKRRILPDKKLGKLLGAGKDDEITYFNLQKYMKVHFPKPASATTPASS